MDDMAMRVRLAQPQDALAVAGVHVRAWQSAYEGLIDSDFLAALREEDRAATYSFDPTDPWAPEMIVATEGEEIVGFATFGRSRDADAPAAGEIRALYVDPSRWSGGIGRRLLAESRERLRQHGYAEAILWVLVGNERAASFYAADGWLRDGAEREEEPYGVVSHVLRYRRALVD